MTIFQTFTLYIASMRIFRGKKIYANLVRISWETRRIRTKRLNDIFQTKGKRLPILV